MRWPSVVLVILLALAVTVGCAAFKAGREFPSPDPQLVVVGRTDKVALERIFGEPYEVGIDSSDPTWTWFFGQKTTGGDLSKSLTVRFNQDGTVKSYSFSSNFPEDMKRLK